MSLTTVTRILLIVEVLSFIGWGVIAELQHKWKLGLAQLLLAAVQWLIYA